jgi:hypothetical protein
MCFSATASFTAATVLSSAGIFTISKAKDKSDLAFAAIPLLFGLQQCGEGVIWLTADGTVLHTAMMYYFSFFSNVLWPTFIPLSVLLMEKTPWRRRVLMGLLAVGIVVSSYLLYYLIKAPLKVEIVHSSLAYVSLHVTMGPKLAFYFGLYFAATCLSCLFSRYRYVKIFGIVAFASAVATYGFWSETFISVWCFFAAFNSVFVLLHVRTRVAGSLIRRTRKYAETLQE